MKYLRKISLVICCLLMVFVSFSLIACDNEDYNPYTDETADYTYTINKITSTVTVNGDSTVDFVEEYEVDFHSGHLGIYRDLPLNSGEKYRDIKILKSEWSEIEHWENVLRISLGLPDGSIPERGEHSYEISYTLVLPERTNPDNFYMNLVGYGWNTDISEVDITLTLPEKMSGEKFYHRYGSTEQSDKISCVNIGENKYRISAQNLSAFEGITIDANLPAGTIAAHKDAFPFAELLIGLVFAAAAALLIVYAKKGQQVIPITNYYPPEQNGSEMTPADVGLHIDGNLSASDATSMIFYWASKGYIEIEDVEDNNPKLVKKREISVTEAGGRDFLRLFDTIFSSSDIVSVSSLEYKLSGIFSKIMADAAKKSRTFYSGKATTIGVVATAIALIISVALFVFRGVTAIGSTDVLSVAFIAMIPLVVIGYAAMFVLWRYEYKLKGAKPIRYAAAAVLLLLSALITNIIYEDVVPYYASVMVTLPMELLAIASGSCQKRKEDYIKTLGEIVGFKDFLTLAEKDKLEMLLHDNPQYYYDILPYANVLGVSEIWENKFEGIALEPPAFISGYHSMFIDYMVYRNISRSLSHSLNAAMVPRPSKSSSSGFGGFGGGGGFHGGGGGFGGGGGGAR